MSPSHERHAARIMHIDIEPDRFGLLHPVVFVNPIHRRHDVNARISLDRVQDLSRMHYARGDLVEVGLMGQSKIARLGQILEKGPDDCHHHSALDLGVCRHCQQNLTLRDGDLFCPGEHCPSTTYARATYAVGRHVLDIDLRPEALDLLIWGAETITDVTSLLFLDHTALECLGGQEGIVERYDPDEIAVLADTIAQRRDQLFGRWRPSKMQGVSGQSVQAVIQKKTLDALSIQGLHHHAIAGLTTALAQNKWTWEQLPEVLTDVTALRNYGIGRIEAHSIVGHAQARIGELDQISRGL